MWPLTIVLLVASSPSPRWSQSALKLDKLDEEMMPAPNPLYAAASDMELQLVPLEQSARASEHPGWLVVGGRIGGIAVGWAASALVHEVGHALIAWGYGYKFRWPTAGSGTGPFLPYWEINNGNPVPPEHLRDISAGGFVISLILEEMILHTKLLPKNNVFVTGFLFYSLLNAVGYVIRDSIAYAINGRGIGDIRDMACSTCSNWRVPRPLQYSVLLIHSAATLVRLLQNPQFAQMSFWSGDYLDD